MTSVPELETLNAEITRAVGRYAAALTAETVTGTAPGVTVRADLNANVLAVELAEDAPYNWSLPRLGEHVVEAITAAATAAAHRRAELASGVQLFDEPVVALTDQMSAEPQGSLDRLSSPRYW